jgi:acyl dehydratase
MKNSELSTGTEIAPLTVTPDRYLTLRYAGASGDFNPIHVDPEFAREVGLPGPILHGLWTMAQVARAATRAVRDPAALKRLSVEFRGMGVPEREIIVSARVRACEGERLLLDTQAIQGEKRIVRNGEAELLI